MSNLSITNYQYSGYGIWYDWESAVGWNLSDSSVTYWDSLTLYDDGCAIEDNKNDCWTACQNVQQVWNDTAGNSTYTIHNCAVSLLSLHEERV